MLLGDYIGLREITARAITATQANSPVTYVNAGKYMFNSRTNSLYSLTFINMRLVHCIANIR